MVSMSTGGTSRAQQAMAAIRAQAPLAVSTAPLPGDLHLTVYVSPDAELGCCDVHLAAGRGCRGRGRRPLDDARTYAATLRRLAAHITSYATAYEDAALQDSDEQPDLAGTAWAQDMAATATRCPRCGADDLLDPEYCHACRTTLTPF